MSNSDIFLPGTTTINGIYLPASATNNPFKANPSLLTFTENDQQIEVSVPGIYTVINALYTGCSILLTPYTLDSG